MNKAWKISRKRAQLSPEEVHALLDIFPFPAIIIDKDHKFIGWANEKAVQLTGYARDELCGAPLATLFAGELGRDQPGEGRDNTARLTPHRGNPFEVSIEMSPLGKNTPWLVLRIEKSESVVRAQRHALWLDQLWPRLIDLWTASMEAETSKAISLLLIASQSLLEAEMVSFYQISGTTPSALRIGDTLTHPLLPEVISVQDLVALKTPRQWVYRNSPHPQFHNILRKEGFRFIASAPLGSPQALTGVVIAAARQETSHHFLETLRSIALTLSSFIDHSTLVTHLEGRLDGLEADILTRQAVWDGITDSAVLLDADLNILDLNKAAENSLGYAYKEVINLPINKLFISDADLDGLFSTIRAGSPPAYSPTIRLYRRHGTSFQTMLRLQPILHLGKLERTLVLFQDITKQEQYRMRQEQLEQRALLGEVTASFAHEVRNPINNISTGLQVLEMSLPADDPNQENIYRLQQDCNRLTELIKSGLSFIKPLEYQLERINLNDLISSLLDRWHNRLAREKIQHLFQPEPVPPVIEGDPRAVEQIFNNLFTNAAQAIKKDLSSEASGTLAIKIKRINQNGAADQIEVSVSDTGGGIPEDIRDHIFEPFFTTKPTGTGLGLAIVKRIVTAHKGSVHVNSYPGVTVFSVRFPSL